MTYERREAKRSRCAYNASHANRTGKNGCKGAVRERSVERASFGRKFMTHVLLCERHYTDATGKAP